MLVNILLIDKGKDALGIIKFGDFFQDTGFFQQLSHEVFNLNIEEEFRSFFNKVITGLTVKSIDLEGNTWYVERSIPEGFPGSPLKPIKSIKEFESYILSKT